MKKIGLGILIGIVALVIGGIVMAWGIERNPALVLPSGRGVEVLDQAIDNSPVLNKAGISGEFVTDEIIVKFKGDKEPFRVLKVPEGKVGEKIKEYLEKADVVYAEPNYIAHALWIPNDPYYSYQWHLDNPQYGGIQMEKAWEISTGSNLVIVAIVDTGIAYENYGKYCQAPDLAQTCFVQGKDFVNGDLHPNDDNNHGTHVAGTVAQSTNNGVGVAGVAFNTCLMPVKVLDSRGSGSYANVALGIRYAADNGAKVINLSLGGTASDNTLRDAVAYAYGKGVTVVAACGNDNQASCLYPAAYDDYVIAVGATQYDETKAPYSNYGPSLDLVAPGGNNNLDQNGDGYVDGVLQQTFASSYRLCSFAYYFFQGTSMATPHVSGVAALLIANGNATTPDQIRTALQSTAEDLGATGKDDTYGYGLVDAYAALTWKPAPVIACSFDTDCNDNNECTTDVCNNPGTTTAHCSNTPVTDGTTCMAGICCSGTCALPVCSVDTDCNDNNACTIDTCNNAGSCAASCSYTNITACVSGDGCCPAGCTNAIDSDCPVAVKCWSGTNLYLYKADDQAKKFCKCAQGSYGYNRYKYNRSIKTAYKYVNTADNTIWDVTSLSAYGPIYSVTCTDGLAYPTNLDYYYPK
jgi:serine protease